MAILDTAGTGKIQGYTGNGFENGICISPYLFVYLSIIKREEISMRKFADVVRDNDSRYFETTNGKFIAPLNLKDFNYWAKVDLDNMEYIPVSDEGYETSELPTINELIDKGRIVTKDYCRIYDVYPEDFDSYWDYEGMSVEECFSKLDIDSIIREFKENGFNVSRNAIEHNFSCWLGDMKSGYRGNGYHLFTPCGCNPLSFRATSLDDHFDWQTTYEY